MTDDKWEKVKGMIYERFSDLEEECDTCDDGIGEIERLFFSGHMGDMKLERTTRPKFMGEKTLTSRRIGGSAHVEKVYSEDEEVSYVKGYRKNELGDWVEMEFPV